MLAWVILFLCLFSPFLASTQDNSTLDYIEGRVLDRETKEPVAFASVLNVTTQSGTVSNSDGYFRVMIRSEKDSILVSIIGYSRQQLIPASGEKFYEILLEQAVQELKPVNIIADESYLYNLLEDCRKKKQPTMLTAKAYYELRSFSGGRQVELVECLYNAEVRGYDIEGLEMKAGRFALRENDGGLFISLESSRAIVMHNLFRGDKYFDKSPLELPLRKMKTEYRLRLVQKYMQDHEQVFIIECEPRDTTGAFFLTTIWINPLKKNLLQIDYRCRNVAAHPFVPITKTDSILNVDMYISKKFTEKNGHMSFSHIDFFYDIDYKNATKNYSISTKAVLMLHDRAKPYEIPRFDFSDSNISDYRKINAMPYNTFIWQGEEMTMNYRALENNLFFMEKKDLNSSALFAPGKNLRQTVLKYPYIQWSAERIGFGKYLVDSTISNPKDGMFIASFYNLGIKIFLDVNIVNDSLHVTTVTILDPYESWYRLPIDNSVVCFINIYFDLVEIERRALEEEIKKSAGNIEAINQLYDLSMQKTELLKRTYFNEVQRGSNLVKMRKWNQIVTEVLGIDNMKLFGL